MFVPSDLHGHSTYSDGRASPEEYVEFRRQQGLRVVALSDHDVLAGVVRGAQAAAQAGLLYLPAVEVTAFLHFGTERAEQFHVLAYYPPRIAAPPRLKATALYQRGLQVQQSWQAFVLEWAARLGEEDRLALDPEDTLASAPPGEFPALQSMIRRILDRCPALYPPFQKHHLHFWDDRALFAWTPEEAIELIRSDGATDIVAHPARYRDVERTAAVLDHASGLEVYTSRHKPEVAERYRQYAMSAHKLWTASSDDHQNASYQRPPCGTPVTTLDRLTQGAIPLPELYAMSA